MDAKELLEKYDNGEKNFSGAYLYGANLEGAYLYGANLERANLKGANLERANLERAYLEGANLEGANLEGANLEGAYLYGAYLYGATIPSSSHDAISEILRQNAETTPQYMLAGLVLMRRDWCWREFISNLKDTYPHELRWALRILAEQKGTDDKARSFLEFVSSDEGKKQSE